MILNADDGLVRGLFTAYYMIMVLLMGIIGNFCCRSRTKLHLLLDKRIDLASTGGWIKSAASFAKALWDLRSVPCGWLGWLMLLISLIVITGGYAVNIAVKAQLFPSVCRFNEGMLVTTDASKYTSYPSNNYNAYRYASNAQLNNMENARLNYLTDYGGNGIFQRVTNSSYFLADPADYLGWWACKFNGAALKYTGTKDSEIWNDLVSQGLLYDLGYSQNVSSQPGGVSVGNSAQLFIVTASTFTVGDKWDIKAAVDTYDIDGGSTKMIQPYHCSYYCNDEARTVEKIVETISISNTLQTWGLSMQGSLYPSLKDSTSYDVYTVGWTIEWFLNSMVMVAGSGESVISTDHGLYGCLAQGTNLPGWVLGIAMVLLGLGLFISAFAIYLFFRIRAACHNYDRINDGSKVTSKEICENAPNGLWQWICHAAYESRDVDKIPQPKELTKWTVSTMWHGGRRLGLVMEHEHGMSRIASAPQGQSQFSESAAYYSGDLPMAQKGQYTAVQTSELR